ncbi:arabinofuranosyltransferase [Prauserella halophila]|uniref:arabinofuranosyltransferase n=1 Tax=Prauserella halophila TaxID=185641 RepID=UPI0020A61405|nr:arabinofuranosyltransferase [Prauserella halophila]
MSTTGPGTDVNEDVADEDLDARPSTGTVAGPGVLRRLTRHIGPSTTAVACYLAAMVLSWLVIDAVGLDPLTLRGAVTPVAVGAAVAVIAIALAVRFASDRLVGAIAGVYAGWIGMMLMNALNGTPFGHNELHNWDTLRMSALANRLTTTWGSTDAFLPGLPSEYPVLYPWLVARASELLDRPTWTLIGDMEVLFISASALVAFLLWRRLTSPPIALAMAAVAPIVFMHGHKSYEILTLAVFVPWALATFAGLPRKAGGLHWLPAGIVGGLFVCTYTGYLMFGVIGGLAIIVARLLRPDRRPYLLHLLGVLVTSVVVSSWYVVPLVWAYLTETRNVVADTYPNAVITEDPVPLPFLEATPIGLLALAGLFGVFWYRTREWWAQPTLLLVGGIYLYWAGYMLQLVADGHTGFLVKTPRMVTMVLVTAGVLTLARTAGALATRLRLTPPRSVGVAALAVLLVSSGLTAWDKWTPGNPKGFADIEPHVPHSAVEPNPALRAHMQPGPDGERTEFVPPGLVATPVPADRLAAEVETRLGADARPMSLSTDMRLYAYELWWGYLQRGHYSANSLMRYTERSAELTELAAIEDPQQFARASANTRFGGIDVFVLRKNEDGWLFDNRITFEPDSFRGGAFDIVDDLPADLVLAVRTP